MLTTNEILILDALFKEHNKRLPSSTVRRMLEVSDRIVLKKKFFPNTRQYLEAYMTSFGRGIYRGGFCWVSVIEIKHKNIEDVQKLLDSCI